MPWDHLLLFFLPLPAKKCGGIWKFNKHQRNNNINKTLFLQPPKPNFVTLHLLGKGHSAKDQEEENSGSYMLTALTLVYASGESKVCL